MRKSFLIILLLLGLGVLWSNKAAQAAPELLSVNPPIGTTSARTNTNLTFAYNQDMDTTTFGSSTFTLYGGIEPYFVNGTFSYSNESRSFRFNPDTNLDGSQTYSGTITTGVKNIYGTPTAAEFGFSFITGATTDDTNVGVWYAYPYNNDTGVAIGIENIYVVFSERQDVTTIGTSSVIISNNYGDVAGSVYYYDYGSNYSGTPTAVIKLDEALDYYTTYYITVRGGSGGVLDMCGNPLSGTYTSSFTTESAPPAPAPYVPPVTKFYVTDTSPKNGEETNDARCPITVKFNINVDTDWSLATDPFYFFVNGEEFFPTGTYSGFYEDGGGKKIIFTPSDDWPNGEIKISVKQNRVRAANRAGTFMEKDYEFSFSIEKE